MSGLQLESLDTAAARLEVSTRTIRRRIADGTIRGYRVGRNIRVDRAEVDAKLMQVMSHDTRT
jgi:excisionase family DNA binding protein